MKYFKFILKIYFIFLFLFIKTDNVLAEGEFTSNCSVLYTINENGIATVEHNISLYNNQTDIYAKSYDFYLENIIPQNPKVIYKGQTINPNLEISDQSARFNFDFPDIVVGKNKVRNFNIVYNYPGFAQKTGEIWEINIPKLSPDAEFNDFNLTLKVPIIFGQEAYITPRPQGISKDDSFYIYTFNKKQLLDTTINAGFGSFQVFSFTLNYHLENPLSKSAVTEIAIPPDTNLQKVYFSSITPKPVKVSLDEDGNFIAQYALKARERMDVVVNGSVQIFSNPRIFPKPSDELLSKYLKGSEYWNVDNPKIKNLAANFQSARDIYDFVVGNLTYSFENVSSENKRKGAVMALDDPKSSTCLEFTDLFIALTRANKIPSRELNGFAYTENSEIQPLSLVNDVLHSWPEYWDNINKRWVQIDPTWASTTGGINYFDKLDLRHFVFVIHGIDSSKPYTPGSYKLGPNPQKDVFVNFGTLPENRNSTVNIKSELRKNIPFMNVEYKITILNEGPATIYNLTPIIYFDGKISDEKYFEIIPPFGEVSFDVKIPQSVLGRKTPSKANISALNEIHNIKTYKNKIITDSLILVLFIITILVVILLLKVKPKLHFLKYLKKH